MRSFFGTRRRRGLVVVLSDFLDPNGVERGFGLLRYFRHDVFAVQIASLEEARPELPDEVVLTDSEDGAAVHLDVTLPLLAAYRDAFEEHCRGVESYCWKHGWGYVRTLTDIAFEDLILQVFRQDRFLR